MERTLDATVLSVLFSANWVDIPAVSYRGGGRVWSILVKLLQAGEIYDLTLALRNDLQTLFFVVFFQAVKELRIPELNFQLALTPWTAWIPLQSEMN